MVTKVVCFTNSDDALLLWSVDSLDDGVRGFSVQRELTRDGVASTEYLNNYAHPGPAAYQQGVLQPSDQWPFRSFSWTDHGVSSGDRVSYRVIPVFEGEDAPREAAATGWTDAKRVGAADDADFQAFFNRGYVISQFVSRYLDEHYPGVGRIHALEQFKKDLSTQVEDTMRVFLSGGLRTRLLHLLDTVIVGDGEIHAALFELSDPELIDRLVKLGPRAHVVLANGSIQPRTHEPEADARQRDENSDARAKLIAARVDVEPKNRFVAPKPLAHNKFLVISDAAGKRQEVWTGSTNWTPTGLCTQLNNGLLVRNGDVADAYFAQWNALRAAGSDHPGDLAKTNATPTPVKVGTSDTEVHFTRTTNKVDLTALGDIVRSAKKGLLFLMFMPGPSGVLAEVEKLARDHPELLVRGVVSELPNGRQDEKTGDTTTLNVSLYGASGGVVTSHEEDVVQPEGNPHPTAWWAAETTHNQFLGAVGHAIIHSKVLVVDPFGDEPIVVTGSHNFSTAASNANDENFIVIKGNRELAEAYAVNIETAWRHYAGRIGNPHGDLQGNPYLQALLADQRRTEVFWGLS